VVSEHIYRDWTGHKEEVFRPLHEYCGVEIFSYEHKLTKTYHNGNYDFKGENHSKVSHRHLTCFESKDKQSHFTMEMDYNCLESGDYRIDILYENKNSSDYVGAYTLTHTTSKVTYKNSATISKSLKDLTAYNKKLKEVQEASDLTYKKKLKKAKEVYNKSKKTKADKKAYDDAVKKAKRLSKAEVQKVKDLITKLKNKIVKTPRLAGDRLNFDGEPNILKRTTLYVNMGEKGNHKLAIDVPVNCYFVGVIIRKIKLFTGDNVDSAGTNLSLTECSVTHSDMVKPSEASFTVSYSQTFDNPLSRSGFYMDYMDEVNVYYRVNDKLNGEVVRRFGGYISTVKLDDDRTTLQFSCADRLQDGENKYILDSLLILKGTVADTEWEYYNPINFQNYGQALKYICDVFEVTLDSNISKNYLVAGEKYSTAKAIKFGKNKDIKKIKTTNCTSKVNKNSIMLRNNASGKKKQVFELYNAEKHVKKPIDITNHLTFHMTYGLGATKSEKKNTTIEQVDNSENAAGSQKFGKCGRSQDGKYLMAIGQRSVGKGKNTYPYHQIYRTVFENKCPHCGGKLVWDSGRKDTDCVHCGHYKHSKREWGNISETEITCSNCCADFCSVTGWDKDGHYSKRLKYVKRPVKSSKAEQNKLHNGEMSGVAKSGVKVSSDDVLKSVAKIAKKYKYERGTSATYSSMKKSGKGDCHAFSDLIFTELKKYKVACRIYEFSTSQSSTHQEVYYKNAQNGWSRFPYAKYNLNHMLYTTKGANLKDRPYKEYKGGNIANVTTKGSNTSTNTTTTTSTYGYDKDAPLQGYIQIIYSTTQSFKAKTKTVNLNFTQKAGTNNDVSGLSAVWVNNATRQTSVDLKNWFADNEPNQRIYLQGIKIIAPKIKTKTEEDKTTWYTSDKSTKDNSSCKMNLYQIIFDDRQPLNPTDLQSCGKTVIDMLGTVVEQSKYLVSMTYEQHRCDDRIHFRVDNDNRIKFEATEGDNNNILNWSNITYTPVSTLRNKSICVFKDTANKYKYVDTADIGSMLNYGEKTTLQTISEQTGSKEAYFNARNTADYNPEQQYTYTIVVPYAPKLELGDLVQVVSNYRKLNDVKTVESIKITYKNSQIPKIQTEIGLDEIEPYLRIRKEQEALRKQARSDKTYFGRTASPIEDPDIYIWDA